MSFFEQFATVVDTADAKSCNGVCTYDTNCSGSVTDHESC